MDPTVTSALLELGTETANLSQEAFEKTEQFLCVHAWKEEYSDNSECSKAAEYRILIVYE